MAQQVLGVSLCLQGNCKGAQRELEAAVRYEPQDSENWVRLGETYEALGLSRKAGSCYEKAVAVDRMSPSAHAHLGAWYAGEGNRQPALEQLKAADQLGGSWDVTTAQYLCLAYSKLHDLAAAIYYCQTYLRIASTTGINPEQLEFFTDRLRDLQRRVTPQFVSAARPRDYSPEDFNEALRQRITAKEISQAVNPLQSTPEMNLWAKQTTAAATNDMQRARLLFEALMQHPNTGVGGSRTAEQAFVAWKKGATLFCQEYAYLYVALARAASLEAYDVSVDETADGAKTPHACAAVFIGKDALLVDPADFWFGAPHKRFQVLDDLQVLAVYLAERDSLRDIEVAAKLDPASAFVRGNLTMELMEMDHWDEARQSLAQFLKMNPDPGFADYLEAHLALHEDHPDSAIESLRKCVEINPDLGQAYLLMAVTYQDEDKLREARAAFRKALGCTLTQRNEDYARKAIAEINEELGDDQQSASQAKDLVGSHAN